MTLTHILTPLTIGGVTLKNRVVRSAHGTNMGRGRMNDDLIAYHEARAKGGVGLTIIEILSVHPTTPGTLNIFQSGNAEGYARLVDACRPHGMKLFQQLWHGGAHAMPLDGTPPWAPSDIPSPLNGAVPRVMTKAMIDEIVESFAKTARACADWGLEGAEVHAGHGFLPQQFLSAHANRRDDAYGGPLENRMRFLEEILRAIRAETPQGFALGVRLSVEGIGGGLTVEENSAIAAHLEREGLIDYLNLSLGSMHNQQKLIGGMHEPMGYELPTSVPIARAVRVPRMVIGRFRTLEEADAVIRAGDADLIGMTRAHIADPDLVAKTVAGYPERVRPCIACNQGCVGNLEGPAMRMACVVNPGTGAELSLGDQRLSPVETPRTILVIGGGPSGMEAARTAATRGHKVILAEAGPRLGGTLALAASAPTRYGLGDITTWLEQEVYRLGVDVRLSTYLDADDVRMLAPDHVILATGASPRMDGIQVSNPGEPIAGFDQPHVLSSHDLFSQPQRDPGRHAVVIDDLGHYEAIAAAEQLIQRGCAVTYVSRHISFAPLMESTYLNAPALARLQRGAFSLHLRSRALRIDKDSVTIAPTFASCDNAVLTVRADSVVFVSANRPNRDLADALDASGLPVTLVGDAAAPGFLQAAIRSGHMAGAAA